MTDLIERVDAAFPEELAPLGTEGQAARAPSEPLGPARPLHVLLSVALGGSAVLLFAMASGHLHGARAATATGAALVQLAFAVAALTRPSRGLFWAMAAANVATALVWPALEGPRAVSAGTALVGVVLSVVAVVVASALALRPDLGGTWTSGASVIGSVVPVAVAALTMVGLFATSHTVASPPASASSASGGGASAALALSTTVTVPGESSKTFQSTIAGNDTEQSELAKWVPLNPHDQAILTVQLAEARSAALRFPTVASAKAAGMILAGGMAPGVGAHYQLMSAEGFKGVNPDGSVNALYPASWIYAGTGDNDPVVGVMYESLSEQKPSGFIGPNDHWHRHSNVCIQIKAGEIAVPFAADQSISPQECKDVGGIFMKKTIWMVHAWVVPGWESPQGVFSHDNLHVYCPGNTDLTDAVGFCQRQS